jgi:hypothetical protein
MLGLAAWGSNPSPYTCERGHCTDVTDGLQRASADASATVVSRPTLVDLNIVAKMGGKQEVGVRIVGGGGSFDGRCVRRMGGCRHSYGR